MDYPLNNQNIQNNLSYHDKVDFHSLNNGDGEEIDLFDLIFFLWGRIKIIGMATLVSAIVFLGVAAFLITPKYKSTAKLYAVSSKDSVVDISDLSIGTALTKDYEELILSYPVLNSVIKKLNLDMTTKQLAKMITITNPTDTRILNIAVIDKDPEEACMIANTIVDASIKYLPKTMSTNAPNIAQRARIDRKKVSPSYIKFTLIGFILGLVGSAGFFVVQYIRDDSISSAEDLEKYFGVAPLTVIPEDESNKEKGGK